MNRKDHLEKYYQKNGRFQTKRDKNSIGFCVISNYREDVVISLTEKEISFEEALKAKNLPDPIIFMYACTKYNDVLDIKPPMENNCLGYWINVDTYSDCVNTAFGDMGMRSTGPDNAVCGVGCLSIDDFPFSRYCYWESRLYREMWRIEK